MPRLQVLSLVRARMRRQLINVSLSESNEKKCPWVRIKIKMKINKVGINKSVNGRNIQNCRNFYEFIWAKLTIIARKQNLNGLRKCSKKWHFCTLVYFYYLLFFKRFYLFIFRETRREEEREGEKHWSVASYMHPRRDATCNPGMCPDREPSRWVTFCFAGWSPANWATRVNACTLFYTFQSRQKT